jgi:hypothetical protein
MRSVWVWGWVCVSACTTSDSETLADASSPTYDAGGPALVFDAGFAFPDAFVPLPSPDAATEAPGACEGAATASSPAELHAAALDVLAAPAPCGFGSCHSAQAKGNLALLGVVDLRATLVDKPACEAPRLSLVPSGGGEAALSRSWLWLKLQPRGVGDDALPSVPAYGMAGACGQSGAEPHGRTMPLGSPALSEAKLTAVRAWICAGAPGPSGP